MQAQYVRLISARREDLWQGPAAVPDDLAGLKERRGERIAAVDPEQGLLGWITVYPDRDAGGAYLRCADIQVLPAHRGRGIGTELIRRTGDFMRERKLARLKLDTSPLLTWNAGLFMKSCGMRYAWKEGRKTPGGRPWPYVSAEWDPDDPLVKPVDLDEEAAGQRSVLDWDGKLPAARRGVAYSGPLYVPLPDLSGEDLIAIVKNSPQTLTVLHGVFQSLFLHGYRFAWFDTLSRASIPGCRRYYLMESHLGL
ncbi:MAG TPA: GNAT family N-acetyltransferase [Spirochaetia bacterium]|nr:GNAT family N-acetyltransferase [Spirochaetia bacterium]